MGVFDSTTWTSAGRSSRRRKMLGGRFVPPQVLSSLDIPQCRLLYSRARVPLSGTPDRFHSRDNPECGRPTAAEGRWLPVESWPPRA